MEPRPSTRPAGYLSTNLGTVRHSTLADSPFRGKESASASTFRTLLTWAGIVGAVVLLATLVGYSSGIEQRHLVANSDTCLAAVPFIFAGLSGTPKHTYACAYKDLNDTPPTPEERARFEAQFDEALADSRYQIVPVSKAVVAKMRTALKAGHEELSVYEHMIESFYIEGDDGQPVEGDWQLCVLLDYPDIGFHRDAAGARLIYSYVVARDGKHYMPITAGLYNHIRVRDNPDLLANLAEHELIENKYEIPHAEVLEIEALFTKYADNNSPAAQLGISSFQKFIIDHKAHRGQYTYLISRLLLISP